MIQKRKQTAETDLNKSVPYLPWLLSSAFINRLEKLTLYMCMHALNNGTGYWIRQTPSDIIYERSQLRRATMQNAVAGDVENNILYEFLSWGSFP